MKQEILKQLIDNCGKYVPSSKLANEYNVTRSAIWKAIIKLREQGYDIEAVSRKGYKLISVIDKVSTHSIRQELQHNDFWHNIIVLNTVSSTNSYLKTNFQGEFEGIAVIAEEQTGGRGRLGRDWVSPKNSGIYLSVMLKPNMPIANTQLLSLKAALAVRKAILSVTNLECQIKWPNDIVYNNRKIAGILSEITGEIENYCVIIGIGINANTSKFDEELSEKATSIRLENGKSINRVPLIVAVLDNLAEIYISGENVVDEYKKHCLTIGRDVKINSVSESYTAHAIDISDNGELIVRLRSGEEKYVNAGEVSVRGVYGYVD